MSKEDVSIYIKMFMIGENQQEKNIWMEIGKKMEQKKNLRINYIYTFIVIFVIACTIFMAASAIKTIVTKEGVLINKEQDFYAGGVDFFLLLKNNYMKVYNFQYEDKQYLIFINKQDEVVDIIDTREEIEEGEFYDRVIDSG